MYLSHPSISIYPDDLWWTIHSSGMLMWIYLEYYFSWWKIMGGMKNLPSDWVKTINMTHDVSCSTVLNFSYKEITITDDILPISIGIKPNSTTVPHLGGSWLNIVEVI